MNFLVQNKMKITNEGIFQRHWCEYRVGGLQENRTRSLKLSGWQDLESTKIPSSGMHCADFPWADAMGTSIHPDREPTMSQSKDCAKSNVANQ